MGIGEKIKLPTYSFQVKKSGDWKNRSWGTFKKRWFERVCAIFRQLHRMQYGFGSTAQACLLDPLPFDSSSTFFSHYKGALGLDYTKILVSNRTESNRALKVLLNNRVGEMRSYGMMTSMFVTTRPTEPYRLFNIHTDWTEPSDVSLRGWGGGGRVPHWWQDSRKMLSLETLQYRNILALSIHTKHTYIPPPPIPINGRHARLSHIFHDFSRLK